MTNATNKNTQMWTHVLQAIIRNPNWCDPRTIIITLTGNDTHRCPHRRWGSSCWSRSSAVTPAGSSWVQRLWRPLGHWCTLPGHRPPCTRNEGASKFLWLLAGSGIVHSDSLAGFKNSLLWFTGSFKNNVLWNWQFQEYYYSDTLAVSRIVCSATGNFQNSLIRFTVRFKNSLFWFPGRFKNNSFWFTGSFNNSSFWYTGSFKNILL